MPTMKKVFTVSSLLVAVFVSSIPAASGPPAVATYQAWVRALSEDSMEGRGLGTEGIARAAAWIEQRLREEGLRPAFGESYRQPFRIKTGVSLLEGNRLSSTISMSGAGAATGAIEGVGPDSWTPLGFSSAGAFEGDLVFAGYGIEAPPIGYQELDGLDLKGKVVLMLRYEPQERDDASPFDGRKPSRWSATRYKVHQARERGAAAVIFVTGPLQDEGSDKLPVLRNDGPESPAGIPVIQVKTSVAQKWLAVAPINLADFQKNVDRDLLPRSQPVRGVRVKGNVALESAWAEAENVAGILPGRGALASEIVVVGAHYDHLGMGGDRSMRPNEKAVHNGADDNASGVAAVLLAARRASELLADTPSRRTLVFALFSGEEVGLAGSAHMVENFPFPLERVVAMINLDMVGYLRDGKLAALGADSAAEWAGAIQRLAAPLGLEVTTGGDGYGPSDQTSFYAAQIPVVHFFTGSHDRYHTPDDDAEFINVDGGARIAELTAALAASIARGETTPAYARVAAAPAMQGDSRGYGAYLGTVPDYRAMTDTGGGVLISDVRPGGPADLAGLRGGDRIVRMAGTKIENLYDMTFALQDHKPGETVDVVVIREGSETILRATLGSRAERGQPPTAAPAAPPAAAAESHPAPAAAPRPLPILRPGPNVNPPEPGTAPAGVESPPPALSPHAMPPPAAAPRSDFYANRPGAAFEIRAGKPFEKRFEGERHLRDIRQLTFGGENAEAYFSPDGTKLTFQATREGMKCDQQFVLDLATGETTRISSGKGRTTCGYYDFPEGDRIIYASTESGGEECPPPPDFRQGYVWAVYDSFELWQADPDGSNPKRLTWNDSYDAEATWCHRGGKFVFTSMRDGDLDLYESDEAGNVRRLTSTPGYDGGAFYSPDCSEIVWRSDRPEGEALAEYRALLEKRMIRPGALEIFVMNADGSNVRQVTSNGAANFCPYFHPDGQRIIWASNVGESAREFDLWMVDKNGGEPERITTAEGFDGFPMWSPDGEWIVWASNRADPAARDTNLFIARWVE
jgi:Tol biopolymer transport system component